jgi:hypothetical protein
MMFRSARARRYQRALVLLSTRGVRLMTCCLAIVPCPCMSGLVQQNPCWTARAQLYARRPPLRLTGQLRGHCRIFRQAQAGQNERSSHPAVLHLLGDAGKIWRSSHAPLRCVSCPMAFFLLLTQLRACLKSLCLRRVPPLKILVRMGYSIVASLHGRHCNPGHIS